MTTDGSAATDGADGADAIERAAREQLADRLLQGDIDVDRSRPHWCAQPADDEAVARLVRLASQQAEKERRVPRLLPVGGGTHMAAARPDVLSVAPQTLLLIDTSRLSGVVEYVPGDGTLTARAGTPWSELAQTVAVGGHELTPDVPRPVRSPGVRGEALGSGASTLGGILAAGVSGPDRLRCGPLRQHVLGAVIATGSGTLARSGGRLVKNVTGFDVFRLHVGGRGTLGVILQASMRLMARPEHEVLLSLDGLQAADAFKMLERLRRGTPEPRATWAAGPVGGPWQIALHLTGRGRQVEADTAWVASALGASHQLVEGPHARIAADQWRDTSPECTARAHLPGTPQLTLTCATSAIDALQREVAQWSDEQNLTAPPQLLAWPGVARLEINLPPLTQLDGRTYTVAPLIQRLAKLGAHVESLRDAPGVDIAAHQPSRPDASWQKALPLALDPARLFAEAAPSTS